MTLPIKLAIGAGVAIVGYVVLKNWNSGGGYGANIGPAPLGAPPAANDGIPGTFTSTPVRLVTLPDGREASYGPTTATRSGRGHF